MERKSLIDASKNNPSLLFKFEFQGETYETDLGEELAFNTETLNQEMSDHPRKTAVMMSMLERKEYELSMAELTYNVTRSTVWTDFKNNKHDSAGKTLSDTRVDNLTDMDEAVIAEHSRVVLLRSQVKELRSRLDLFKFKKELMQTFAANSRHNI